MVIIENGASQCLASEVLSPWNNGVSEYIGHVVDWTNFVRSSFVRRRSFVQPSHLFDRDGPVKFGGSDPSRRTLPQNPGFGLEFDLGFDLGLDLGFDLGFYLGFDFGFNLGFCPPTYTELNISHYQVNWMSFPCQTYFLFKK